MARTIQTHELTSFSIQDWTQGQRWGDAVAGDVEMDWTRLPSGGKRPWFLCPSCGRRCGVLYSLRSHIICRKCGGLSYESQNEPRHFRALRKAQKIRVRLGGSANLTEPFPSRPRYMLPADLPVSKASVRGGGGAVRGQLWRCGLERDHRHGGAVGPRGRRCDLAGVGQHCTGVGETLARHTRNLAKGITIEKGWRDLSG